MSLKGQNLRSLGQDKNSVVTTIRAQLILGLPAILGFVAVGYLLSGFNSDVRLLAKLAAVASCVWLLIKLRYF